MTWPQTQTLKRHFFMHNLWRLFVLRIISLKYFLHAQEVQEQNLLSLSCFFCVLRGLWCESLSAVCCLADSRLLWIDFAGLNCLTIAVGNCRHGLLFRNGVGMFCVWGFTLVIFEDEFKENMSDGLPLKQPNSLKFKIFINLYRNNNPQADAKKNHRLT